MGIVRPTTVEAGTIDGAIMMIPDLVGMVDGVILIEMTLIALAIRSSLITARGGRASTAKSEGQEELVLRPEVSDGYTANP